VAKHRTRLEILADVLRATGSGARKTRIMYAANLSYKALKKYLEETVNIGFNSLSNGFYEVTESGELFLKKYVDFSDRYSKMGEVLQSMTVEKSVLERMCQVQTPRKTVSSESSEGILDE
jgi:predicted transcriptional regulator